MNDLRVYGGIGDDFIQTGAGVSNIVHGEGGNDTIISTYSGSSAGRWLYGDDGEDFITGTSDIDYIYGGNDDDIIKGVAGADRLFGEQGNDYFLATSTSDFVYYDGGTERDTILVQDVGPAFTYTLLKIGSLDGIEVIQDDDSKPTFIFGSGLDLREIELYNIDGVEGDGGDNLLKGGISIDTETGAYITMELKGNGGNDTIKGYLGDDILKGGEGDDDLFGMAGYDELTGGSGADKFHFDSLSDLDLIEDFNIGEDKIYLHTLEANVNISLSTYDNYTIIQTGTNTIALKDIDPYSLSINDFVISNTTIAY